MGNLTTNSEESLLKLKRKTGGLGFWLSPAEQSLIDTACGVIAITATIPVPGPAPTAVANIVMDYMFPVGLALQMELVIDGGAPITVSGATEDAAKSGEALSRFVSKIEAETGVEVVTDGGSLISETNLNISAGGLDVTIVSFSSVVLAPGEIAITKSDATQSIQGYIDLDGYFQAGSTIAIEWTSTPSGAATTNYVFAESVNSTDAVTLLIADINADPLLFADDLAPEVGRIRFFASVPETALNCDSATYTPV